MADQLELRAGDAILTDTRKLGQGAANTVHLCTYRGRDGEDMKLVFKPEVGRAARPRPSVRVRPRLPQRGARHAAQRGGLPRGGRHRLRRNHRPLKHRQP